MELFVRLKGKYKTFEILGKSPVVVRNPAIVDIIVTVVKVLFEYFCTSQVRIYTTRHFGAHLDSFGKK